jgi:surface carbohydrate biosynthesis protein
MRAKVLQSAYLVFQRIIFQNPRKSEIAIFDDSSQWILNKTVLYDMDYTVVHARHEKYHLTIDIGIIFIKYLFKIKIRDMFSHPRLLGFIYKLYLLSCIAYIQPKVVVTFIDNNFYYQWISRKYQGARFFAVQNGVRYQHDLTIWLPDSPREAKTISMPTLFCFGQYEIDLYRKHNHQVDEFFPIGSLRGGYFQSESIKKRKSGKAIDILYVSQWVEEVTLAGNFRCENEGIHLMEEYLLKYATEKKKKVVIMTRTNKVEEIEYFKGVFGTKAIIIKSKPQKMLIYKLMWESNVMITFCSTAAIEAFGWGKKIFSCNFSGDDNYDMPGKPFWFLKLKNFKEFKRILDDMRHMDESEFYERTENERKYLMNYSHDMSPHLFIRKKIQDALEHQSF